jgi:hypothetical protein
LSLLVLPGCGRDWIPGPFAGEVEEELQCLPGDREGACPLEGYRPVPGSLRCEIQRPTKESRF